MSPDSEGRLADLKILLISFCFPPYNDVGHVRVGKLAKFLLRFGHDVQIISARDQPFPATLPIEVPEARVLYTKWVNVNKPAELVFGGRKSVAVRGLDARGTLRSGETVLRRLYRRLYKRFISFPDDQVGWFPYAYNAAARCIERWKPDVICASAMPFTSLLIAHRLSRRYTIPWVADLRDLWVDHQNYKYAGWRRAIEGRLERRILTSATGLVTVSEPLAAVLRTKYTGPVSVVMNGFDPDDYPDDSHRPKGSPIVRIAYTGMIYEGKQRLEPLFEALAGMPRRDHVRVTLYGRYLELARRMAAAYAMESLVEVHDAIPYRDSLRVQRESDVLLLLLWSDPREKGVYTGKLFEYIGAGRPILAIGPADNVAADLIAERAAGVVLQDAGDIRRQLERWIDIKQGGAVIPPTSKDAGLGLSREEQARRFERVLLDAMQLAASIG